MSFSADHHRSIHVFNCRDKGKNEIIFNFSFKGEATISAGAHILIYTRACFPNCNGVPIFSFLEVKPPPGYKLLQTYEDVFKYLSRSINDANARLM